MAPTTRENPFQISEDKLLVGRLLAGDENAFERFSEDYLGSLFRFALSRLGNDEPLAQEAVQATVATAISALDKYRGEASLFSWMCGICRHEISALLRQKKRAPVQAGFFEDAPEVRGALEALAFEAEGPDAELQRRELARLVHLTLDHLPARYGKALEWKYLEGLPVVEIAARLELGPKAAESVLTRAREAFRNGFESLRKSLGESSDRGLRLVAARRNI